nr:MAG TPA: hypothetical protein [Caudoviricetes sp.]
MAKLTHSEYSIQVLEAAFAKGREVRHNVLVSHLPNFQVLSKIDDGVFWLECDGNKMLFPRDFNPEVDWYMV